MYTINEAQFLIPSATWKDSSMNVFREPHSQCSLIVARSELSKGKTFKEELKIQCEQLKQVATNITISPFNIITLNETNYIEALETNISFLRSGSKFYQRQLAILLVNNNRILLFSYTSPQPFNDEDEQYWVKLKNSIVITD